MAYLLGSESEAIRFADGTTRYAPAGGLHAVEPSPDASGTRTLLCYAVCGTPVRVWPGARFDPRAAGAHDGCVDAGRPESQ